MDCWSSSCWKAALLNSLADGSRICWRCRAFGGFRTGVEERRLSSSSCSNAVLFLPSSRSCWWIHVDNKSHNRPKCIATKSNRFNGRIDHQRMSRSALHHAPVAITYVTRTTVRICYSHEKFLSFFSKNTNSNNPITFCPHALRGTRAYM